MPMAVTKKVVAIGPRDEMLYLRGAGIEFVPLKAGEDLAAPLRHSAHDAAVGLTLVSETAAEGKMDMIGELRRATGAVVLVVPSHRGSTGSTMAHMRRVLEQSVGVDLLGED
jgi:V/A-type H+-transporting ATPase subunit F